MAAVNSFQLPGQGFTETPRDRAKAFSVEKVSIYGRVKCTREVIDDAGGVALIRIVIKDLMPYLGNFPVHFRQLKIIWESREDNCNGHTMAIDAAQTEENEVGVEIFLNKKYIQSGEALLSTLLHELAHVLTFRPFSLILKYEKNHPSEHDSLFYNMNILLLKVAKGVPEIKFYFNIRHKSLNVFKYVNFIYHD